MESKKANEGSMAHVARCEQCGMEEYSRRRVRGRCPRCGRAYLGSRTILHPALATAERADREDRNR
jgi:predicted Zn-ribbon and HTH transcriptional regulator